MICHLFSLGFDFCIPIDSKWRPRPVTDFQVEAQACDVMACAGGGAGPAPGVRHQPPGDGKEES